MKFTWHICSVLLYDGHCDIAFSQFQLKMRTGTDATRAGKPRKKAAKMPSSKSMRKPVTRPLSDAVQQTVMESHSQGAQDAAGEAALSGHLMSFNCYFCVNICRVDRRNA